MRLRVLLLILLAAVALSGGVLAILELLDSNLAAVIIGASALIVATAVLVFGRRKE